MSRQAYLFELLQPILTRHGPSWPDSAIRELANGLAEIMPALVLPFATDTAAVALKKPKTAALCFDKIWGGFGGGVPPELTFFGDTLVERELFARGLIRRAARDRSGDFAQLFDANTLRDLDFEYGISLVLHAPDRLAAEHILTTGDTEPLSRTFANAITDAHGITPVPIYSSTSLRASEYKAGDRHAIVTILSDLDIVDEDGLEWSQVSDFRKDKESRQKYIRFVHWLDAAMVGQSLRFVEDEINIRLDDYRQALREHGIKTILGTCSAILDPRTLLPAMGTYAAMTALSHDLLGAFAAGAIVLARGSVHVAQTLLDLDDVRRLRPEVAFVYEVSKTEVTA